MRSLLGREIDMGAWSHQCAWCLVCVCVGATFRIGGVAACFGRVSPAAVRSISLGGGSDSGCSLGAVVGSGANWQYVLCEVCATWASLRVLCRRREHTCSAPSDTALGVAVSVSASSSLTPMDRLAFGWRLGSGPFSACSAIWAATSSASGSSAFEARR